MSALATRTPARSGLANAIEVRKAAVAEHAAAASELPEFESSLSTTYAVLFAAEKDLAQAKETLDERLRTCGGNELELSKAAVREGSEPYQDIVAAAETAVAVAARNLTLGRQGEDRLRARVAVAADDLEWSKRKVVEAVHLVEQGEIATALAAARLARDEYAQKRTIVQHLAAHLDGVNFNMRVANDMAIDIRDLLNNGNFEHAPALAPWHAARGALMSDPDAPLPSVGGS